ncbi:hybrid sensor histidine kinase/response regulator [Mesorhizobium marinum]|uniref:hybrid sensor histidine kinase/response regulator n=1 Tax=Mesorhizobium marinum TaxID=3228790 RepID=UPI003467084D
MGDAGEKSASTSEADPRLADLERDALVYAAVVDSALDAVIVVDEDGRVVTMNASAEACFGYSKSEALGRSIGELIVPDRHKAAHEAGLARYRATGVPRVLGRRVEMEARRKDGATIPVELAITEVKLPDRRYFTANLRDLSAAKAAETEIQRQRDALHQTEKLAAIGSLLAGVAHELNNPLSVVLGQATMLEEELAGIAAASATGARATQIRIAAERCARVVRSFMAIARQHKAEKRAVQAPALLDGAVELLSYGLRSNGVAVYRDYDGQMPEVFVDPDQLQQIVVNLIVNANQALQETEGSRAIEIRTFVGDDGHARIVVDDSGPGIPDALRAQIFDPFFTTKPMGVGTGIGLSISRGLAQSQGGQLGLVPSLLGGAAFELVLPLATRNGGQVEQEAGDPAPDIQPATGLRALVVDDEPDIAKLVSEALSRQGYRSDLAGSGAEAQALISATGGAYDAVICDLRMPDVDGAALFQWIKAHHPALAGRVLFITGDSLGPAAGRFLAECGRPFLEKPFAPGDVARLVASFSTLPRATPGT